MLLQTCVPVMEPQVSKKAPSPALLPEETAPDYDSRINMRFQSFLPRACISRRAYHGNRLSLYSLFVSGKSVQIALASLDVPHCKSWKLMFLLSNSLILLLLFIIV